MGTVAVLHSTFPKFLTPVELPQKEADLIEEGLRLLSRDVLRFKSNEHISPVALQIPDCRALDKSEEVAKQIALALFPPKDDSQVARHSSFRKFTSIIRKLRHELHKDGFEQHVQKRELRASLMSTTAENRPLATSILNPSAMPVEVAPKEELQPFFDFLSKSSTPPSTPAQFGRGVMFPDGRMDFCKQVVGPAHIADLCKAVSKAQSTVRHFLLGNNICCDNNDSTGAHCIGDLMDRDDLEIETWYLAGNCMGADEVKILCDKLKNSKHARALWLKRNPVKAEGAAHLGDLLANNKLIKVLDLDGCGLRDEGVKSLIEPMLGAKELGLRHLYLGGNAIGVEGAKHLAEFLKTHPTRIKSLYLGVNRLGDAGAALIAEALQGNTTIKRLFLPSNQLTSVSVKAIVDAALTCPNLKALNLGYYTSTWDMGEVPNAYGDQGAKELLRLVKNHGCLEFLSVVNAGVTKEGFDLLTEAAGPNLYMPGGKTVMEASLQFRRVKHPKRVVDIDSVYRTRM
ncbi:hypothetical protein BSKO_12655 [Bryopsis sp. KO-2023]|nr:hypothetical protein BSKO_12655 [Bryopsis sp. KO-2023]